MKKLFIFLLVVLIFVLSVCGCERKAASHNDANSASSENTNLEESLTDKLLREIEGAYLKESHLPEFSTTSGMVDLADTYTKEWERIADEYYEKIMEHDTIAEPISNFYTADDLHTYVSRMKTDWEQYVQVQLENYLGTLEIVYNGGTIVSPLYATHRYQLQKDWALLLVGIYQELYFG